VSRNFHTLELATDNILQIAEAYRRFGVSPATKDLIVIKVSIPTATTEPLSADKVWRHLEENVKGSPMELADEALVEITDLQKVRKYYKLNGLPWLDSLKDEKAKRKELEGLILGGMALRGI
jgi:EKC/KEOPS complex subunit CGI121/TPRKB